MTTLPIYQVDAFAEGPFSRNPAAVVLLQDRLPEAALRPSAAENNLPATAFVHRDASGCAIRWFPPTVELPLCGHGTLAAAHVVLDHLEPGRDAIDFASAAGTLHVERRDDAFAVAPPLDRALPRAMPAGLGPPPRPPPPAGGGGGHPPPPLLP